MAKMSVAEFISKGNDVDIVDDVCEELYIAVCRPMELTEDGKREFAEVLGYIVDYDEDDPYWDNAVLCIDGDGWKSKLRKAERFFWAAAGYCDADDWDRWFK